MYGLERIGKGQRADELFKKGEVMFGVINGSPKCQGAAAKEWLAEREAELRLVGYFHLVFTLPGPIADAGLPSRGNRTLAGRRGDVARAAGDISCRDRKPLPRSRSSTSDRIFYRVTMRSTSPGAFRLPNMSTTS
jgi:transposase-like zinc-binding protein